MAWEATGVMVVVGPAETGLVLSEYAKLAKPNPKTTVRANNFFIVFPPTRATFWKPNKPWSTKTAFLKPHHFCKHPENKLFFKKSQYLCSDLLGPRDILGPWCTYLVHSKNRCQLCLKVAVTTVFIVSETRIQRRIIEISCYETKTGEFSKISKAQKMAFPESNIDGFEAKWDKTIKRYCSYPREEPPRNNPLSQCLKFESACSDFNRSSKTLHNIHPTGESIFDTPCHSPQLNFKPDCSYFPG